MSRKTIDSQMNVLTHEQRRARRPISSAPFKRSKDRVVSGIAGGLAKFINVNPTLVRVILFVALIASVGILLFPYLILWWRVPLEA